MQDITEDICRVTPEGREAQLEDKRDGNKYWVGRMKDGRCWMLQNLALGSTSTAITLTSGDSDVGSDWNLPKSYTVTTSGDKTTTVAQSWDLGKYVLATPLLTENCSDSGTTKLSGCTKVGFVDVSDTASFQPTYTATTGTWNGATVTSGTLIAVNCTAWSGSGTSKKCTAGTYDPHYLTGKYYNWNAATAGNNGGSICPKGWELPYIIPSGSAIVVGMKEFGTLLAAYDVTSSLTGTVDGITYNIAGAPLRFVRSGYVFPGSSIAKAGKVGRYWSSTSASGGVAYRVGFGNSDVTPSGTNDRWYGFSVRCVAEWSYDFPNYIN